MAKKISADAVPALKKILGRAEEQGLSEKSIDFIKRTAEKGLNKMNCPEEIGQHELIIMIRGGMIYDDEEKAKIFHRTLGEENWGEKALVFLENFE